MYSSVYLKAIKNSSIGENDMMMRHCNFRFQYYKDNKLTNLLKGHMIFTSEDSEWGFKYFIK